MEITVGSDYSGVGAFDYAIDRVSDKKGFFVKKIFACDFDYHARVSFIANHGTSDDLKLAKTKEHKYFSDNVKRIALLEEEASREDKIILVNANEFAKRFSFYYPFNVYDREIPNESIDIYMTSPPCQAFSNAGKRKGKEDVRGILFFNSLEFIDINRPRVFIFENVEGLLSHDNGNTFSEWINLLGGKSINGNPVLFPYPDSVPYHLYYQVVNSRKHGVPQNRPRIFLVGIRDDQDSPFIFPNEEVLKKSLGDCLENSVDEKFFLSEEAIENLQTYNERQIKNNRGFSVKFRDIEKVKYMDTLKVGGGGKDDLLLVKTPKVVKLTRTEQAKMERAKNLKEKNKDTGKFSDRQYELRDQDYSDALLANPNPKKEGLIAVIEKSESEEEIYCNCDDSNLRKPDILCDELKVGTWRTHNDGKGFRAIKTKTCPTIPARAREDGSGQPVISYQSKIRRLTPLECFRLQDFPDEHVFKCIEAGVSDTQLYKQAGNSITVRPLQKIISNLKLFNK